jgi:serine/threonine protein kinase
VLKRYFDAETKSYENEMKAYKKLSAGPMPPPITTYYGNFQQVKYDTLNPKTTNYVIIEYADRGTLKDYFTKLPPSEPRDIINFWKSLCNIAKALQSIHTDADGQSGSVVITHCSMCKVH